MKHSVIALLTASIAFAGCASNQPTSQLRSAREAYTTAKNQPNSAQSLDSLDDARNALTRAEKAHEDDPGSYQEASLAYVAERKAQLAIAKANMAAAKTTTEHSEQEYVKRQGAMLETARNSQAATQDALQGTNQQLTAEHAARVKAEQQAKAALDSLKELAAVKEESRGTVITLDGSVLFVSGQADLMPVAKSKLEKVAASIQDVGGEEKIRVLGFTDSRGNDSTNQELSRKRAQSVADQLIRSGIESSRVEVEGRGESDPVATNETPEGRANNRRVEIVLATPNANGTSVGSRSTSSSQSPSALNNPK